jgi:hypothetical protein
MFCFPKKKSSISFNYLSNSINELKDNIKMFEDCFYKLKEDKNEINKKIVKLEETINILVHEHKQNMEILKNKEITLFNKINYDENLLETISTRLNNIDYLLKNNDSKLNILEEKIKNNEIQNHEVQNHEIQNHENQNNEVQNHEVQNKDVNMDSKKKRRKYYNHKKIINDL